MVAQLHLRELSAGFPVARPRGRLFKREFCPFRMQYKELVAVEPLRKDARHDLAEALYALRILHEHKLALAVAEAYHLFAEFHDTRD